MINFAFYKSPVGIIKLGFDKSFIYFCDFIPTSQCKKEMLEELSSTNKISKALDNYFAGKFTALNKLKLKVIGTTFQIDTWRALKNIKAGNTASYQEIAKIINAPKSSRAVGSACNKNPILLFIPCHRIISSGGKLTGYRPGIKYKKLLLQHEKGEKSSKNLAKQ